MLEVHEEDVSPGDLRFTQTSIAKQFKKEYKNTTLDSAVTMIRTRQRSPADFGKLVVVSHEGLLWAVNNRRLWVFRRANVPRVNVTVLKSSQGAGLQDVINSPRHLCPLTKNDKENLQKLIDEPAHREKLGTPRFLPYVRRKGGRQQLDAPSNLMVKNRTTPSPSSVPKCPVQPNHASVNTSATTQLPQSRQPQDRGSISRPLKQEIEKRPMIPILGSAPSITYPTCEAEHYKYRRIDQANPAHDEEASRFGSLQAYWNCFLQLLLCRD